MLSPHGLPERERITTNFAQVIESLSTDSQRDLARVLPCPSIEGPSRFATLSRLRQGEKLSWKLSAVSLVFRVTSCSEQATTFEAHNDSAGETDISESVTSR